MRGVAGAFEWLRVSTTEGGYGGGASVIHTNSSRWKPSASLTPTCCFAATIIAPGPISCSPAMTAAITSFPDILRARSMLRW